MILYKRQTREILRNLRKDIYMEDRPLNDWEDNDNPFSFKANELQKNFSFKEGLVLTEERYIPVKEVKGECE